MNDASPPSAPEASGPVVPRLLELLLDRGTHLLAGAIVAALVAHGLVSKDQAAQLSTLAASVFAGLVGAAMVWISACAHRAAMIAAFNAAPPAVPIEGPETLTALRRLLPLFRPQSLRPRRKDSDGTAQRSSPAANARPVATPAGPSAAARLSGEPTMKPNGLFAFVEQDGEILVHDLANDVKIGFTHLKTEAEAAWNWLKTEAQSPQVQSFLARALVDAEQAAAALVEQYGAAMQPKIQNAVTDSQTFIANLLNAALGGNVKQNLTTIPAAQDGVAQLGSASGLIAQQAFGLVVAKLLAGAV